MPQIRSEWNTVTDAKTARKRSLQSLMEMFLSTSLHERNVRPGILHLMKLRIRSPDLRVSTNKTDLLSFIYPQKLPKKVLKNRSITLRSLPAKNWELLSFYPAATWVGRVLRLPKLGALCASKHCTLLGSVSMSYFLLGENHKQYGAAGNRCKKSMGIVF